MQNQYGYIYESSQYEQFERSILSGHLTETTLLEMASTGKLDERQMVIAEGFFSKLRNRASGLGQAAKTLGSNVSNAARYGGNSLMGNATGPAPAMTNVKSAYQSGTGNSAIRTYTKKLIGTLQKYLDDLHDLNVLTPQVEQLIDGVAKQLESIAMAPPTTNANAPVQQSYGTNGQSQAAASNPTFTNRPANAPQVSMGGQGQGMANNSPSQFQQAAAPPVPAQSRGRRRAQA